MDYYQKIVEKTVANQIPFAAHFELTYRCNINCIHCYCVIDKQRSEMPLETVTRILDELAEMGCLYVAFSGGEIFCRSDLNNILVYAAKKGFAIRLMTNGTLLDRDIVKSIKSIAPIAVEISLYSMKAELHDQITGFPGSYEKTCQSINKLLENNIKVIIKTVFMKQNVYEYLPLKQFCSDHEIKFRYDLTLTPKIDGNKDNLRYRLNAEELLSFLQTNELTNNFPQRRYQPESMLCNAGHNALSISPYGDVFPCVAVKQKMGNLNNSSLNNIWHSDLFAKFRSIRFDDLKICPDCRLLQYCHRCIGESLIEDGDLLGPSTSNCLIAEARSKTLSKERNSC
ncbi:MAG: hypothetical protein A2161_15855 [Candidatus Schekmanbacteria bacterium RBG_13_48_7]|uniref:Radical SAM core domain-containing protein n=1 Tax=Candidatus Schekmanbacteria bacterium RBG_13_48_7 TaxID=1817878 RepID=A0A1F7RQQ8_9BACT|nr:MAG: hypothetical protein A2161_15855 [Candidatus Schekmanbacteria bacterium RBG_13_48_7]